MSYEVRIGILAAVTIAVTVWGYQFMKGKNLLRAANTYYIEYTDVDKLTATSPVMIRGLRVGTVTSISLNDNMNGIVATVDIDRDIRLAEGTVAYIVDQSIMGGKAVVLDVPGTCEGSDCINRGSFIPGRVRSMFESMIGAGQFNELVDSAKMAASAVVKVLSDSLAGPDASSEIARTFRDMQVIMANLAGITSQLNASFADYDKNLKGTLQNVEEFTSVLAVQNNDIAVTLQNMRAFSDELAAAQVATKLGDMASSADAAIASVESTMGEAEQTLAELRSLIDKMNSGEGSFGKIMTDEELYDNLARATENLDLLLQDFRLNPKRYVNVSVFGKKQKEYVVPENDPAHAQDSTGANQ